MVAIILLLSLLQTSQPEITRIEDAKTISLLNSLENKERFEANGFSVGIFNHANPPGSAGFSEGHEISRSYYLAISEFDEYPVQSLFLVGGFYNPSYKVQSNQDHIIVTIEHGASDNRKTQSLKVMLHQVNWVK